VCRLSATLAHEMLRGLGPECVVRPALHTQHDRADERLLAAVRVVECDGQCVLDREAMMTRPEKSLAGWVKLSFCVGYVGFPFHGLQFQPHMELEHTVEGVFLIACERAGLLEGGLEGGKPARHHEFARSCRTDAGVHAARNQVTMNVREALWRELYRGPDGIKDALNAQLAAIAPAPWRLNAMTLAALPPKAPPTSASSAEVIEETSTTNASATRPPPPSVVVLAVTRVAVDYVPRNFTTRRVYRFLLPLFCLDRRLDSFAAPQAAPAVLTAAPTSQQQLELWRPAPVQLAPGYASTTADERNADPYVVVAGADVHARIKETVGALVAKFNEALQRFVGRHRFHNYTGVEGPGGTVANTKSLKIKPADNEAVRVVSRAVMLRDPLFIPALVAPPLSAAAAADGAVVYGLPYVMVQMEGESFLLHMIRKVVGTAIAVSRGASLELIDKSLDGCTLVNTPMVPGSGLLLHLPHFDSYDSRDAPAYPRLCCDWARHRHECMAFEEVTLRETIALREAVDCKLLPAHGWRPVLPVPAADLAELAAAGVGGKVVGPPGARPPTVMTVFLRLLRMHNWEVRKSPYAAPTSKRQERKAARQERLTALWAEREAAGYATGGQAEVTAADDDITATDDAPIKVHRTEANITEGDSSPRVEANSGVDADEVLEAEDERDAAATEGQGDLVPSRRVPLSNRLDNGWIEERVAAQQE
jgi:tRNA U38,U39,U40 pseudouridine synthase TruA